jgi:hypothetical protein
MKEARHQKQVRRCTAELRHFFPMLTQQHKTITVIAAIAEHLGGALYLSQQANICTPDRAREVIEQVRQIVFET